MNVFISWSGERSKHIASELRGWLPKVIQAIKPWMSDRDIASGARWSSEIAKQLENSKVGIICITPENQLNPWLTFEAGAISKTLRDTYVCPYLFSLTPSELSSGPITQFQAVAATKGDTLKLIETLNSAIDGERIGESELKEIFELWWPRLESKLNEIQATPATKVKKRSSEEIANEILSNTRELIRLEEIRLSAFEKKEAKLDELLGFMKTSLSALTDISHVGVKGVDALNELEYLPGLPEDKRSALCDLLKKITSSVGPTTMSGLQEILGLMFNTMEGLVNDSKEESRLMKVKKKKAKK